MTDDEVISLAKSLGWNVEHAQTNVMLARFAKEVAAHERNEIATEFERRHKAIAHRNNYFLHAANYVRSRV